MISWSEETENLVTQQQRSGYAVMGQIQQRLWLPSKVSEADTSQGGKIRFYPGITIAWQGADPNFHLCRHDCFLKGRMGEGKRREVGCSILSNAFSASTEMTIWFLSCILLTGVSQWLIFIWWTSWHPRDKSHLIVVWDSFNELFHSVC